MSTTTKTTGQVLAETLRKNFAIGARTRRHSITFGDLHKAMIETITNAVQYEGYYSTEKTEILRAGWGAALSYEKHVEGYRIDGLVAAQIAALSPYQFAALLGRMADAGVTNTGGGERFFEQMARELRS